MQEILGKVKKVCKRISKHYNDKRNVSRKDASLMERVQADCEKLTKMHNELKMTVSRVQEGRKSWRDEAINARRQPTHMSKKRNSWQGETLQAKKDLEKTE